MIDSNKQEKESYEDVTIDYKNLTHIFIVMEYVDTDFYHRNRAVASQRNAA